MELKFSSFELIIKQSVILAIITVFAAWMGIDASLF